MKTTIILPTYNEAENLKCLIPSIQNLLADDTKITVVDDNSPNGTSETAWKLGCRVITRTQERGLSSAILTGINLSNENQILVLDADGQHPPEIIPKLLQALEGHDIVVASRYCKGGRIEEWPLKRKVTSQAANLLSFPLYPEVKDRTSGFFALKKSILDGLYLNPVGFKILLEILVKTRSRKPKVIEIPYTFKGRTIGESKLNKDQYLQYLKHLWSLYLWKLLRKTG